ncbi:MAG TPA: Gfo/Idh/MocA family oxidoreductase [Verrucomicrobiae bacterium]|jgi:predicted dehydrogenase|nr:Gfo/Idh/MocA family oxidoreductase [Verrucomicrobiae bacterium]
MNEKKVRWGILGGAQIARKNWKAIQNSGNGSVIAVASRDLARAREFVADCQKQAPMDSDPRALGSYEELVGSPDVDAVYIPLPTGLRKEWVLRAAEAGKHVVCEKPCAISPGDLREMIDTCRQHRVQFMDGVMFMHSVRLKKIREVLDRGGVGEIKRITSAFSFAGTSEFFASNIRVNPVLEPYGSLGDLGWYCIRLALWTMKEQMPCAVTGRILKASETKAGQKETPSEFSGELLFDHGISSSFYCSFVTSIEQWAQISGSTGVLRMADFVLPFFGCENIFETNNPVFAIEGCDFNMEPHWQKFSTPEYSNSHPSSQETNLFRNFAAQILSGKLNETWPEIAFKTQQVMDACFQSAHQASQRITITQPAS